MSAPEVVAMVEMPFLGGDALEHARLSDHLLLVRRLKAGCENRSSVVALTVGLCSELIDEVVCDVAWELHRGIGTGLETTASVSQRVPPTENVVAKYAAAVVAQEAEAEASGCLPSNCKNDPSSTVQRPATKDGRVNRSGSKETGGDLYGRVAGASKELADCPMCATRVAASRFAHHLERCLGKGRLTGGRVKKPVVVPVLAPTPPELKPWVPHKKQPVPTATPQGPVTQAQRLKVRFVLNPKPAGSVDTEKLATEKPPRGVWPGAPGVAPTKARKPKPPKTKTLAALMQSDEVSLAPMVTSSASMDDRGGGSNPGKTVPLRVDKGRGEKTTLTAGKNALGATVRANALAGVVVGGVVKKEIAPKVAKKNGTGAEKKPAAKPKKVTPAKAKPAPSLFSGFPTRTHVDSFSFKETEEPRFAQRHDDDFELQFDDDDDTTMGGDEPRFVTGYHDLFADG